MSGMPAPDAFFHTLHRCGHAVYWSDPMQAPLLALYNCPWCGAETGLDTPPADSNTLADPATGLVAFRFRNPDGTIPVPGRLGTTVHIHHMTGDVCCRFAVAVVS